MRRSDKLITDPTVINEILVKSDICRLGLIKNGLAYIVPVNYAYSDGVIYIHSAHEGTKMEILKLNNQVSFEIEYEHRIVPGLKACNWTTQYRSVMGTGCIEIDNQPASKKKALDLIMQKYGAGIGWNYDDNILERMTVLRLTVESVTGKQSGEW